jgi:hypothetical protein
MLLISHLVCNRNTNASLGTSMHPRIGRLPRSWVTKLGRAVRDGDLQAIINYRSDIAAAAAGTVRDGLGTFRVRPCR